ncbi:hypothetical protein GGI11_006078 [Coemansia sp. RSA 2049]|nr:hypothetical protein GGI11_006078 [Coemansia sp. RSA 2049]KAJ2515333.1 hypothetical protein H4217_005232 [Coemansia sp. RSA 1939]KAJ2611613.1 hypothetical protein EV177_003399 [Coemansia sp. RSA 1804]KAJ2693752.1 hypothetical protein GGH99_001010 [Coemansia sp. RSA 1285]
MSAAQPTTIDDLDYPKAVITRLIKGSLPDSIAVQKEARQAVTKAATVFVSYIAATANDCAREGGHKTVMASDVFKALEAVGLADFIDRLQAELAAHAAIVREKKERAKQKGEQEEDGGEDGEDGEGEEEDEDVDVDEGNEAVDGAEPAAAAAGLDGTDANETEINTAKKPPPDGNVPAVSSSMDVDSSDDENAKRPRIE